MTAPIVLECPCCGDDGVVSADGWFPDGQALICGCQGQVVCDSETEPHVWVDDCDCGERP